MIMLSGNVVIVMLFLMNAIFRGGRGCCGRDARVVDGQWDQHDAGSVA